MLKPSGLTEPKMRATVLRLHGYDDPLAPPEDVLAIAKEFTDTDGMQFDETADRRSWHSLEEFLSEALE